MLQIVALGFNGTRRATAWRKPEQCRRNSHWFAHCEVPPTPPREALGEWGFSLFGEFRARARRSRRGARDTPAHQRSGAAKFERAALLWHARAAIIVTQISVSRDGDIITANVGSVGQVSSKALRDDQGNGFTMRGGGFVGLFGMEEAELAPSAGTRLSDPDMPRELEAKSGPGA
jgi:hypothetical protein